ncbi:hypothetical protein GHK51_22825 [Sinorhizobium meliloti]|uniref:hypothetical protein n=1 Tax=Rhizobium meliloti TaxID=382 RepID=UPI001296E971|nr:hypothetical protein [Sinorhizobium meliloti]MQW13104.1 hypothetical protein [Sinorhizobium meliloti]
MSNLPFPGFDTLQKVQVWAAKQSGTFLKILGNGPVAFLEQLQGLPDEKLAEAVKLFAFILLICWLITVPLDYAIWHLDVTDVGVVLTGIIMSLIYTLVFCACLHLIARLLMSKTELKVV